MNLLEWLKFWSEFRENTSILKYRIPPPPNENCQSPNLRVSEYPPPTKIVRESKSESFRIPPQNENYQRVQIRVSEYPPPNENYQRVQIRVSEYPPPNGNCQRVQIREFQNTPHPNRKNFRIVLQSGRSYVETNM